MGTQNTEDGLLGTTVNIKNSNYQITIYHYISEATQVKYAERKKV